VVKTVRQDGPKLSQATVRHHNSLNVACFYHLLPGEPSFFTHLQVDDVALLHLQLTPKQSLHAHDIILAAGHGCRVATLAYLNSLVLDNEQRPAAASIVGVQAQLLHVPEA
jgi:hypothetical protein